MYCSNCGRRNVDSARFCNNCGIQLPREPKDQQSGGGLQQSNGTLKRTSLILVILLTIITAGFYYPLWFIGRQKGINSLQARDKLASGIFIFATILNILICLTIIEYFNYNLSQSDTINLLNFLSFILEAIYVLQLFKVRDIFIEHFNHRLNRDISFSRVATFFFQIYYLQYKINRVSVY
jgi:hypothetical protein